MKISEICKITGMNKRTVHFYIEEKLIQPAVDDSNGYYDFSEEDSKKLIFIKDLRNTGISIPEIRSLLKNPRTASHYLNFHIRKLKKERDFIEKNINSMQYILNHLSIKPDFNELYELEKKAKIPTPNSIITTEFDTYIVSLINRMLWGPFFSSNQLSDYQKYIMSKLNEEVIENQPEEYEILSEFVKTLEPEVIDLMYENNNSRYDYIISLTDDSIDDCINAMIEKLEHQLDNQFLQKSWKKYYYRYFLPVTQIYASNYSRYIYESSEYFRNYSINITKVLDRLYDYLNSEEGKKLNDKLYKVYDCYLNINNNNHGELEALFNLDLTAEILLKNKEAKNHRK